MFAGHYFGASDGSRGGERGFIYRQLFSSLEKAVGLFAGGVENASRAVAVSSIGLLSDVLRGRPFCRASLGSSTSARSSILAGGIASGMI
jgi:hypothetical protein